MRDQMPKILSDFEMKKYYNPYFHELLIEELKSDKQDLYYKSCSWTVYDEMDGIHRQSIKVETLGEKLIALDELISAHERQYKRHRQVLHEHVKDWHKKDKALLDAYFFNQNNNTGNIKHECIEQLKRDLYFAEHEERDERHKKRERKKLLTRLEKAQAIAR
ncbi:hypothetical protein [Salinicoccus roseus]|uniref:hypothetical protein n=1 Tax=Salinicoccus roseus TaxID=45670 RepID=UPI0035687482